LAGLGALGAALLRAFAFFLAARLRLVVFRLVVFLAAMGIPYDRPCS
jgi:hypothetical protein